MACLDTSFVIDILRGDLKVMELKDALDKTEKHIVIATPSIMELWVGACLSKKSAYEKEKVEEFISSLEVLDLSQEIAKEAAEIEALLIQSGKVIETEDCMIAATAKIHNQILITADEHFTRISGLKVLKY